MSARLLLFSRKQAKLLWFLKPSLASSSPKTKTLVPFSSSSLSFFHSLSTVPSIKEPLSFVPPPPLIDTNISQQTAERDSEDDDWYGDKYSDGDEDDDSDGDENDDSDGDYNSEKEWLDEIVDHKAGLLVDTKIFIFKKWVKRIKPGEPVDWKYMFDAVSKMCHGYPPTETLSPLVIKLSRCSHADTALDLVYLVVRNGRGTQCHEAMNALLNGLGREKKVNKMKMLLHDMFEEDFFLDYDLSSFRIVVHHLCRLQRIDEALEVLDWLELPDLIINNMITKALCKVGRQEEGLALVDRMRSRVGCAPDIITYNQLTDGFCKAGKIERSQKLFDAGSAFDFFTDMRRKGLIWDNTTYNSLITGFCYAKNLDKAMDLFNEMNSSSKVLPDISIYNILIDSLCKEKRTEGALSLMNKMNVKGLFPNVVTYNAIFRGLRDTNSLDEAFKLMDKMKGQACHPNDETMEILSEWLSAEGETARLKTFISSV